MSESNQRGIKSWAEEDRPREKLINRSKKALTNAELLAIIIGSGSSSESAVSLARRILSDYDNDLTAIAKCGVKELCTFKGIGPAKAISVIASLELGRRMKATDPQTRPKITCSSDSYTILSSSMEDLNTEVFKIILLSRGNKVIKICTISEGGVSGTVVDPKVIFKQAIDNLASGIILSHNHPSGNLKPSKADINITKRLVEAGKLLEIQVLDHLIISESGYYSFMDEGMI